MGEDCFCFHYNLINTTVHKTKDLPVVFFFSQGLTVFFLGVEFTVRHFLKDTSLCG